MINSRKYLIVFLSIGLGILTACGDSSVESSAKSSNNSSTENAEGDLSNKDETATEESKTETSSGDNDKNQISGQEDNTDKTSKSNEDGESLNSYNNSNEMTESKKDEYLMKLNEMEESDRYAEAKTTMVEMEEQEAERYKKWDEKLNEIYGVLKEQFNTEQMDKLREQQRDWVTYRDEAAKEASLKFEGGSTESLEYVATQASLTRERCYELVAKYMK